MTGKQRVSRWEAAVGYKTTSENMAWRGVGCCQGRHLNDHNDWCNKPVKAGSIYCRGCSCSVRGCPEKWGALWPMLGDYRLCEKHNTAERRPVGADDGPDDFDIPDA